MKECAGGKETFQVLTPNASWRPCRPVSFGKEAGSNDGDLGRAALDRVQLAAKCALGRGKV